MKIKTELRGEKIFLRSLSQGDITQTYLNWLKDDVVNQFLEVRFAPPANLSELKSFVRAMNDSEFEMLLGIFTTPDQNHIGNIKLGPVNYAHSRADIGILIGEKEFWGQGLATEAIELLCRYATSELALKRLYAGCYESNAGSRKAFEKAGFTVEAKLIDYWETADGLGESELILRMKGSGAL